MRKDLEAQSKAPENKPVVVHETKPLIGRHVIIGRAKEQAGALATLLREKGATVTAIPFIEIRRPETNPVLDRSLEKIREYDWLILTSVNGVDAVFERLQKLGLNDSWLADIHIAAIGPATKKAIEKHGVHVALTPKEYVAESVVEAMRDEVAGRRILLVRAKVARDVIPTELRKSGAAVDVIEAYETVVPQNSKVELQKILRGTETRPDLITFTSSSTAKNFMELIGADAARSELDGVALASIGPVTTQTLEEIGLRADIEAKEYTVPGLVDAIVAHFAKR